MPVDPIEVQLDGYVEYNVEKAEGTGNEFVDHVEPTTEWTQFRDNLANAMWNHSQLEWPQNVLPLFAEYFELY